MVSLKEKHRPTADYIHELRRRLPREFPGTTFYFLPADMITQVLNFGLPAPIDVEIDGNDTQGDGDVADRMLAQIRHVPGIVDARIQQPFDYPDFDVTVDRTKAAQGGYTERDIASSMLNSLSGSYQITPMFFLNWNNGVSYNLVAQTPQYDVQSLQDLQDTPISAAAASHPAILADLASIRRGSEMEVVTHYNLRRTVDIYAAVQDRDLGAVGSDVTGIVNANRKSLPRGSFVTLRGQLSTMRSAYIALLGGLVFSVILIYLLIVVNFQSWLDPFIIITGLPGALAGIILFLFATGTTLSVPALMGAIMCMGVATSNSILVVAFAKEHLLEHGDAIQAAV
jgi:multidrug efflux pump subunit AcrB